MMAVSLIITGVVQGVGYRAAFARHALGLKLDGWVCNRRDGAVEALIAGDASSVQDMIDWSRRGPPAARVADVEVNRQEVAVAPGFKIVANR